MEPILSIAGAAVQLLLPLFRRVRDRLGRDVQDAAAKKVDELYDEVKKRVTGEPLAEEALARAEEQPDGEREQGALQFALAQIMTSDPAFLETLKKIVEEVSHAQPLTQVTDSGAVAVGGDVRISGVNAAGRDVTIGGDQHLTGL